MSDSTYLSCADTAKLLRGALKVAFPGVKFSVRSDSYAGGASIRVAWTDGPTDSLVRTVTELYCGAKFDGMTDMKSHHSTLLGTEDGTVREVRFGADFVFPSRTLSETFVEACTSQLPQEPNGRDSHRGQCQGCGNLSATEDRWYAKTGDHRGGFCCTRKCAGRYLAYHLDSRTMTVEKV